jgi:CRP/FNR family cyclic AMP-dependent transcriptional regulator
MGYLERFSLFASMSDHERALLERVMVEQSFPRGHVFMEEGKGTPDATGAMFLVLKGEVDVVCRAPAGGVANRRLMGPGDIFGVVALLDDAPRSATVSAKGPVVAAWLSRAAFRELGARHVGVFARFQLAIAKQLAADVRLLDLTLGSAFGTESPATTLDAMSLSVQADSR